MAGIIFFMQGYKAFAIGIFSYILMTIGFTTLIVYERYWWAALVMTIWMIVSFPAIANKIGRWIERCI